MKQSDTEQQHREADKWRFATVGQRAWAFADLRDLMAKATPLRSGDMLAGIAAGSAEEGMAARHCLADLPLRTFLL